MRHFPLTGALVVAAAVVLSGCRVYSWVWRSDYPTPYWHAAAADRLRAERKLDEAEREYQLHIAERLAAQNRPPSENPYFYEIMIGDMRLEADEVEKATAAYLRAKEHEVDPALIVDRLRQVAHWYEQHGKIEEAILFLRRYRALDDFIFDIEIDRLHKKQLSAGK